MMSARRILMTTPTYFRVAYAINPWMNSMNKVDVAKAHRQWAGVKDTLAKCGAEVVVCEAPRSAAHLPDMVFCANAAVVRGNLAFMSKMYNAERRGETPHFSEWFRNNGYTVVEETEHPFEGAAEADFMGDMGRPLLVASFGQRTSRHVFDRLRRVLAQPELGGQFDTVVVRLINPKFYHLDTCFCPIDPETAIAYKPAFDLHSFEALNKHMRLIQMTPLEAERFACNAVVLRSTDENGNTVTNVLMPAGNESAAEKVTKAVSGARVHLLDVSEFIKAGGACKCMTLRI